MKQELIFRRLFFSVILFCYVVYFSNKLSAQSTSERIADTNFYQTVNRFYSHPYLGPDTLDEGGFYARFKREELFWGPRLYPTGSFQAARNALNNYYSTTPLPSSFGNWTLVAPFQLPSTTPYGSGHGRMERITFHPDFDGTNNGQNTNTIYAGAHNGGVWISQDGGDNWNVLNTDQLPLIGISAISVAKIAISGYNNLFIGTSYAPRYYMFTAGIYRSQDGGSSWQAVNNDLVSSTINTGAIESIAINKNNSDEVFAATSFGLFRSANANSTCTWNQASTPSSITFFKKVLYHPITNSTLYASGDDIIKSTDGGSTWTSMIGSGTGLDFNGTTFTGQTIDGIILAVTPDAPNHLYASIVTSDPNKTCSPYGTCHFFFKYDTTQTIPWTQGGAIPDIYGGFTSDRLSIAVSPTNKNEVYVGQTNVWKSTNGGLTFSNIGGYWAGLHADIHDIQFSPITNKLYSGCDGGIYKYNGTGTSWTDISKGLEVGEIYHLGASPTDSNLVLTGQQDVGSNLLDNSLPSPKWKQVDGSDGFDQLIALNNTDMFTGGAPSPRVTHSANGWFSSTNGLGKPCWDWTGNWDIPIVLESLENKIYLGYNEIFKKSDYNVSEYNTHCGDSISIPDVTWENRSSFQTEYFTCGMPVVAIAFAPSDKDYIYAATYPNPTACINPPFSGPSHPSYLFRTKQGGGGTGNCSVPSTGTPSSPIGSCWEELYPPNVSSITSIAIHPENPEKI